MKIAVIAANGRSGQAFIEAALTAGHSISAGVRGKSYLKSHPSLTVVECDATNEAQLENLLSGQEAVASFIGHVKGSEPNVQTIAIQKVVDVMKALGVKRLISLTGTGVRFPGDKISLIDRFLNLNISIIDPARVKDGKNHVGVLKASDLDWTVIRVLKLQNVPPKPFTLREHGPTKWYVGRQEVAQAVLQVLEQRSFVKQAPIIGKP
ncbi:MAG TPA: NAD(P)H-binding protein [Candidatus Saccharimonadales bacterium]